MKTRTLAGLSLAAVVLFAPDARPQGLGTELVASGLSDPLDLRSPPGDARLFVAEQTGAVRIIENGALLPTPYYDASGLVAFGNFTGLRAIQFHPNYAGNGYMYFVYDEVEQLFGDVVLARVTVSAGDPNTADPSSYVELLRVTQTEAWHGGGCMNFGPDGYLYVAFGDGYGHGFDPLCHSQDPNLFLGKMLRLDVDGAFPYAVPADNPFVGNPAVRDEIWHLGLRHPWRWCFDEANGDMWIADVGQVTQEELNYVPAGTSGLNFGWKVMEGTHCIGTSGCPGPQAGCGDPSYTDPILTQGTTTVNCSIAGGFVYRGSALPAEQGNYFFGGYCTGDVWSMKYDGSTITDFTERNTELGQFFFFLTAFGIDDEGEIYILLQTGEVYKIVEGCAPPTNYCPANTNSVGTAASISMTGTSSISNNDMGLVCVDAVPGKPGLFFYGPNQASLPLGEGNLCISGSIWRLQPPIVTDAQGGAARAMDFTQPPANAGGGAILAGSDWYFQFWYRDPPGGTAGFNLSDGLCVSYCP